MESWLQEGSSLKWQILSTTALSGAGHGNAAAGFAQDNLPLNWNRRQRGSASLPANPGGYSLQAAAQARARAALAGDPWLGDASAQDGTVNAPGNSRNYGGGWADGSACTGAPPGTGLYSTFSEPAMRSSADFMPVGRDETWAEVPGGLSQLWQAEPEGTPPVAPAAPVCCLGLRQTFFKSLLLITHM